MRRMSAFSVVALLAMSAAAYGDTSYSEIDLTTFDELQPAVAEGETPFQDVGFMSRTTGRRFYITGMLGPSFANLDFAGFPDFSTSDTVFAAGGAVGVSFERERGRLRVEVEGMGRDTYSGPIPLAPELKFITTNNWSVLTNVWRDFMLTERFGIYGGGGIGAGGYRLGQAFGNERLYVDDPAAAFAWQAGGGIFYEISQRATLDLGYRFFSISESTATGESIIGGGPFTYPTNFAASELLLTLRIYEPFRGWRKR